MRRREALLALGGLGVGAAFGVRSLLRTDTALAAPDCLLQREVTEGPYYLDLDLVRRNIKGDRRGTPLRAALHGRRRVVVHAGCAMPRSRSGTRTPPACTPACPATAATSCAASQRTNASGVARFETIFPGWYRGRTPHIHMKVYVGGDEVHTGQVFFRPAVAKRIYAARASTARAGRRTRATAADGIYRSAGERALCSLTRKGSGYAGAMTIGVDA